ncbi:MAG: methyltransferase [Spirochaetia bacterium]|jgi:16S rRNA (guanine1207-N2)-methyltransferase|nr:methyltransferase [Spirochaetia bacterium]
MNPLDIYVNKAVPFKFKGVDLSFDLSHALFSSFDIDAGSRLLLKAIAQNVEQASVGSIVDIGSGVGVLGIACAKAYPDSSLLMRDRDALASAFSERNARRNRIASVSIDTRLFLEGIEAERYDLVLCNVPAKAGPPVLDRFLKDIPGILTERGTGAIVVVETIAEAALASLRASGAEIYRTERGPGHSAFLFRRGSAAAVEPGAFWGVMERSEQRLRAGKILYRLKGYWGLQEFDTPSFSSELSMNMAENAMAGLHTRRVALINPGVGRVACYIGARARGATIDLCGRDSLSLAVSARNLALNAKADTPAGESYSFASKLPDSAYDLLVETVDPIPRVDTLDDSWASALRILKRGGSYIATMPSAVMDRFEKRKPKGMVKISGKKKKGFACASWRLEA